ncbi:MAG: TlpA family protein disulfide reductase [Chlorobi bacterium]|nr:MAG: TlpA family protein disulfide reductase [Bacteroidota bacterium]KXK35315.1 MAG: thiol-disulfide isomerase-like protein [Chlorobi bacterium OLB6]MBE2265106.1 TlpA family protein disulfide reductase [Flavobacteriales bacterium]MBL1160779.1 TlpA family protein disulfide reductase [Chlorobiota bacterium]MBW7853130.1 TlpA family protein disulfide reductase [Candidatus Kapabacteria bacterium]MCC6331381.1 TlpA family protein disulfide reductase [Ignavibacteria bacterium]
MKTLVLSLSLLFVVGTVTVSAQTAQVFKITSVSKKGEGKVPDFSWVENGKSKSFTQATKGKVTLINIWATWCGPCRKEIPDLISLSNELGSNYAVIGVSVDEASRFNTVTSYVEKNNMTYLNLFDASKELAEAFGGISAIPTTFIIDTKGTIVQKIVGARSKDQFKQAMVSIK